MLKASNAQKKKKKKRKENSIMYEGLPSGRGHGPGTKVIDGSAWGIPINLFV